jgi:hypothetical protein
MSHKLSGIRIKIILDSCYAHCKLWFGFCQDGGSQARELPYKITYFSAFFRVRRARTMVTSSISSPDYTTKLTFPFLLVIPCLLAALFTSLLNMLYIFIYYLSLSYVMFSHWDCVLFIRRDAATLFLFPSLL